MVSDIAGDAVINQKADVLILVLMEYGLWPKDQDQADDAQPQS